MIFALVAALLQYNCVVAQPANWWKDTKGLAIESSDQLDYIIDNQRDKFVLLDFYMQQCHWCYAFQAEWNQLVDDFQKWYGD